MRALHKSNVVPEGLEGQSERHVVPCKLLKAQGLRDLIYGGFLPAAARGTEAMHEKPASGAASAGDELHSPEMCVSPFNLYGLYGWSRTPEGYSGTRPAACWMSRGSKTDTSGWSRTTGAGRPFVSAGAAVMFRCSWSIVLSLSLVIGCASPPAPECQYAETAAKVQLAAAHVEAAVPAMLPAEEQLSGTHPVQFYVQIALERNPEILAAQRSVAAEVQTIPQQTALEDPMLTDTFWPLTQHSPQTASGRMPNSLMLTQRVPWLSKLRVRGEVAEQEAKIALTQLAQAQLNVVEQVHLAYYDIHYYERAIEITLENETLLQDLIEFAGIRFRTGGSQQDVLRAQLELDRLRDQLIGLRRQLRMAQADLAALLHTSQDLELQTAERLDVSPAPEVIEGLYELAVRCRPELQERLHAIVRDERRRELAALEYYPDVTLGVGWDYMTRDDALSAVADGSDNLGLTVGIDVPIWRDRLRAGVREAEHRTVAAARRYDAARDETFRQIRRLIAQADALEQQITLYRDNITPRAEQTLRVSLADYRVGKVDFLQVIDNYSELLTFEIQLVRFQTNLGQTLASLERIVGCQLAAPPDSPEIIVGKPMPNSDTTGPDGAAGEPAEELPPQE